MKQRQFLDVIDRDLAEQRWRAVVDASPRGAEAVPLADALGRVLDNDTDVDLDTLTVSAFTPTSNGTVVVTPSGGFTYTPTPDFCGPDSFTYTVSDGEAAPTSAMSTSMSHA